MLSNVPARFAHEAAGMRIDRDNVLAVTAVIATEADRLRQVLETYGGARMGKCGGDPVSGDAMLAFNLRADALVASLWNYVKDLEKLADSVADAARTYGIAESDVAAAFPA
ncbi:MAG: hypothetical protein J0I34_28470 [Pseudonocardia sp.]|uniref:hypothetical protein n=1 Tax=unclassified Pseudonocardia TaxID=2619320 RepID=UPI000868451C|nr:MULTISPECIES: hypothetical protein [unclassified Pseudonocardia]MBN9112711.1 hypothetical protein [Pseudonocardia sp.]ODU19512.1 MAG: hypothetical protein ABS80_19390 [Pseudonocardia sp. SCN 72-51]ODV00102.1 MAG: hypothetical protein ABT15_30290 [Pseudonocardia sp. SCN 73-27]